MKPDRLNELVDGCGVLNCIVQESIRSALLAVERDTVERCAAECDKHATPGYNAFYLAGAYNCAESVRALLAEE